MLASVLAFAAVTAADIGPAPSFDEAQRLGNAALAARLIDPDSARISWPYALVPSSRKGLFADRKSGWATCGRVNSKNRMGGYSGEVWFLIMFKSGQVIDLQIGDPLGGVNAAALSCDAWLKDGTLKPLAITPAQLEARGMPGAITGAAHGGYGFSYVMTPYGLYVVAVAPGSKAQAAGLKAGADIVAINGATTIGMSDVQARAIIATKPASGFDLELSGAQPVHLPPL